MITEPGYNNGYLLWDNDWDSTTVFNVQVYSRTQDPNGGVNVRTVLNQTLTRNYFKLDASFTSQIGYGYKLSALDGNRNLIAETDTVSANPQECWGCGPNMFKQCTWVCNGTSYAWELALYAPQDLANGRLIAQPTWAFYDSDSQTAVPYYEAMSAAEFTMRSNNGDEQWQIPYVDENKDHYVLYNVQSQDDIYDSENNIIFGTDAHFLRKTMKGYYADGSGIDYSVDYSAFSGIPTDLLDIGTSCGQTMTWAQLMYNNESYHDDYPLPLIVGDTIAQSLGCVSANQIFQGDVDFDDYPLLNFIIECNNETYEANELNLGEVLAGLDCGSEDIWIVVDDTDGGSGGDVDLEDIVIQNVSVKGDPPTIVDPEDVFDSGDPFVANDDDFETGLYKVLFVYGDGTAIPLMVEHDADTNNDPIANSDFASLTIAPNPIVSDFLDFKVEVDRRMAFKLQVRALDGTLLHEENRSMQSETELKRSIKVPQQDYPYQQLVVKLVFEDYSTLEEIALRPNH